MKHYGDDPGMLEDNAMKYVMNNFPGGMDKLTPAETVALMVLERTYQKTGGSTAAIAEAAAAIIMVADRRSK